MRLLLIALSSAVLFAQAPAPAPKKAAAPAPKAPAAPAPAKNFKLSGNPAAKVTLEVYTDYECPSCRNLYMETIPGVMAEYVATGKIQLLHRDFPLPMHTHTKLATRYANAAGQIGRYELAVAQIFRSQPEWSQNGNIDGQVAKVLAPADMAKVRELVKNDTHLDDTVTADVAMGNRDALNQTPTIIVVSKGKRTKIDGAVPFVILKSYIDQILAKS